MSQEVFNEAVRKDIDFIKESIKEINAKLDHTYVTKEEFKPYKLIIQGAVAMILTSVFGALIYLVIKQQ